MNSINKTTIIKIIFKSDLKKLFFIFFQKDNLQILYGIKVKAAINIPKVRRRMIKVMIAPI
ncbi:hypothetical protein A3A93_01430 [Candidatus Roizmanbacteria bacterium RIFCSPLOWO2_01_FULL_38_12]|uniref:Uncharacterized protein n=1 Tax=Candidatus Roizmanbacteria bacterium RIFCSPLOWO2_01_FULL_38_12 TaxID=1802061 RepID=A0A1F7IY38_9BACT|nr:MAG: hypothetical protein A2861_00660 [Candidatus Roizmanbacteria bacterium RIFCSPHIGHO2_01_FULL_38_15]OGK34456.1 MAG: hypothetical protein A3F59_03960 [Candidatus Roizmanbacteria bacterium RIFCSPHIGHO2_12_FULL_38_13]OGK48286.1 MAG: hypothetical protein A3A93_01430 [Candidatus Roizmanbacteria bacterium RIFCSPLOWO2_01_FULL_38_12]